MNNRSTERGAVAVEFAVVVPLLLLLIVGMVEIARIYNVQITVTQAAREGAREMAIHNDVGVAQSRAVAAAPGLAPALAEGDVAISPGACAPDTNTTATITYTFPTITGLFAASAKVTGIGVMRCGG